MNSLGQLCNLILVSTVLKDLWNFKYSIMSHSQLSNVHRLFISYGVSSSSVTYRSPAFKNKKTPVMGNTFVMYNYFKINALMTVLLALLSQSQTIKNHELFFSRLLFWINGCPSIRKYALVCFGELRRVFWSVSWTEIKITKCPVFVLLFHLSFDENIGFSQWNVQKCW